MDKLLDTALENVIAEVARIREETKSGILRWSLKTGMSCTYTLQNSSVECTLQCCQPDYFLTVSGEPVSVPQDLLAGLCETIKQQVKQHKIQGTVDQLKSIQRQC